MRASARQIFARGKNPGFYIRHNVDSCITILWAPFNFRSRHALYHPFHVNFFFDPSRQSARGVWTLCRFLNPVCNCQSEASTSVLWLRKIMDCKSQIITDERPPQRTTNYWVSVTENSTLHLPQVSLVLPYERVFTLRASFNSVHYSRKQSLKRIKTYDSLVNISPALFFFYPLSPTWSFFNWFPVLTHS